METTGHLRQLAAVVDAFTDSVLIFDGEGHILHANAADRAMLSYDARTAGFATTVRERARVLIQRGEDGQPISEDGLPVARVLRGESFSGHSAMEVTIRTADGRDIQVSSSGAPVLDAKGHVIGGVVVTRDVTDPRHLERTLRDANWRMDEILAVAAHDLRTPITASRGYVQLATRRLSKLAAAVKTKMPALVGNIEQLRRTLEDAELSTQRLARLVDRLLDVARVQGNKLELRREVVDLATIVSDTVYEQQLAAPTRTIRSNLLPRGRSVAILADPDRIGQVLLNYLANALKYSPEDSVICVTLTVSDTAARVSVRDEGSGIPEAEQNRIWLRFEQAEYGRQHRSASGLGLGLYISRAIVEAHGGLVGVESEIGRGSTFWFDLPLAPDAK